MLREVVLLCKEGGVRHFEYRDLVLQFAPTAEEHEDEEPRIEGFALPPPTVLPVPDVDSDDFDGDPDDEDGMRGPYKAIFGKRRPKFKKAPPVTSEG